MCQIFYNISCQEMVQQEEERPPAIIYSVEEMPTEIIYSDGSPPQLRDSSISSSTTTLTSIGYSSINRELDMDAFSSPAADASSTGFSLRETTTETATTEAPTTTAATATTATAKSKCTCYRVYI